MESKRKIGLLTFQNAYNHGAVLQMYGLVTAIENMGYDISVINYRNEYFLEYYVYGFSFIRSNGYSNKLKTFEKLIKNPGHFFGTIGRGRKMARFIDENIPISDWVTREQLPDLNKKYDTFVVGSDQVWNMSLSDYDSTYYLDFVSDGNKRISYAASIGKEYITGYEYDLMEKYLQHYEKISVREKKAQEIIKENFGLNSEVVLDPTLLHNGAFWSKIADKSGRVLKKPYILIYMIQKSTNLIRIAEEVAKKENLEIVTIFGVKIKSKHKTMRDASIEDFLGLIKNAKYTFVTSFHGLVFSILFNTPFYYELAKSIPNNNSRLIDLCSMLGVTDREITDKISHKEIDWNFVNSTLEAKRRESLDWLKKALEE